MSFIKLNAILAGQQMADKIRMTYGFKSTVTSGVEQTIEEDDDEGVGLLEEEAKRTSVPLV